MPKPIITIRNQFFKCILLLLISAMISPNSIGQNNQNPYSLKVYLVDKDSSFQLPQLGIQTKFESSASAYSYINNLPQKVKSMGYPVASIDSIWETDAQLNILLYLGTKYNWIKLRTATQDQADLIAAGFLSRDFEKKPLNISQVQNLKERLLDYFEKTGYPFAKISLDSVEVDQDKIAAFLMIHKGELYHIDSIRVYGNTSIKNKFLQRYLNLPNKSIYQKERLANVDKKMRELPYLSVLQASDLTMLGTGSVLNLYLKQKRSSQVNFLVGFLPSSNESKKVLVTGDVNLDLKNLLGTGENFLIKWQQLQQKSPRLNLGYDQPYIFNSPFGLHFLFDLFKKDSNFIQVNAQAGIQFDLTDQQTGKLFVQLQNTSLMEGAVDTNAIKINKQLPVNIDVKATNAGFTYEWNKTNYKFNPRSGNEINVTTTVGIKNIKKNNSILEIKDPNYNYASLYDSVKLKSYQWRVKFTGAHYFPVGKLATVKMGIGTGMYTSPSIFRNELFQIGGFKLLRGFDEESIYATQYLVSTLEYRYLIAQNSYLFTFIDAGFVKNKYQQVNIGNQFTGGGLGILFETKAGLLNLSLAVGKRDDVKFNLRESSKIHFGYINYF